MKLLEVFDKPLQWAWDERTPTKAIAEFNVSTGGEYVVRFRNTGGARTADAKGGRWDFWFSAYGDDAKEKGGSMEILNTGVGIEVFSTVRSILIAFLKEYDPELLIFTANTEEPSRVKLYNRFLKSFRAGGYEAEQSWDGPDMMYYIRKKKVDPESQI